ncbi:FAD binding domain-containing protein [Thiohalorhabdus sp. Cl-TMA]|uniref:Xanthine dehydrogenase family protein subunit M n=1 Tax=Thiohalorhabdus methylotrophus TaxID=3242694 RepID=A0ABV4TV07_9GAMM
MIPGEFEYHAPGTIDEALRLLGEYGDEAKVLAGGHSLLPMMKLRFAEPEHLVDLNGIGELRGIREEGGHIYIGAMTTENQLIDSDLLWGKCPLVPEVAGWTSDPQVRNRGTIGGDIVHGDPGNDHPAAMLALQAHLLLVGPDGEREVPADDFFIGTYMTAMEEGEILREIRIPAMEAGGGQAYAKLKRKTGDYATAAAAVNLRMDGDTVQWVHIGLTNVGPTPLKAADAEAELTGQAWDEARIKKAAEAAMAITTPVADLRGDEEYKTHMAGEMTKRALRLARDRAKGS